MKPVIPSYSDPALGEERGKSTRRTRSRFRTDKSQTRRLIEQMFGPRRKAMPKAQQTLSDTELEAERINRRRVSEAYRLSSDYRQLAKQLQDGDTEHLEVTLTRLARRSMAVLMASFDLKDGEFGQAAETLDNPHRMKGVQVP